jgi:hypothetical protein
MIFIIWRGLGFLVAVITFGCALIANLMSNAIAGEGYFDHHKWPLGVALLISALICWYVGDFLLHRPGRVVIDKKTGKELTLKKSHTFFFIPMHWWGAILVVFALMAFASK